MTEARGGVEVTVFSFDVEDILLLIEFLVSPLLFAIIKNLNFI